MLDDLLGANIGRYIDCAKDTTEIRLRVGCPLLICTVGGERVYPRVNGLQYIVSANDIRQVLDRATNSSLYSVGDEICKGYVPTGHFRIGVAGEGVLCGDKLSNVKNISYLVIRIPHQIKSAANDLIDDVMCTTNGARKVKNTLVISPPGAGKTTLLRELARECSHNFNVVVIDERYEITGLVNGKTPLDIGEVEVISGTPKSIAYENCVRAMNPDVIVTDELFGQRDTNAIQDIIRSGVKVFASIHADGIDELRRSNFANLLNVFDLAITLSKHPVGKVVEKVCL